VALEQLMALKQLGDWRNQGGLMVSDDLGSQAIRKLYDPTGKSFDASQVARSAFLAGNDVLYADNFAATGAPDSYTAMINTLELFTQKYKEDPSFAQRVNASVERILTLKYTLFPDFEPEAILPTVDDLAKVGTQQQVSFDVAAKAVTLISPEPAELNALIPRPPEARERIVFVTDVITGKQCSQCNEQTVMGVDALQSTVLKLYGTRSGGQIQPNKLLSYSFAELLGMLNKSAPQLATQTPQLETDLRLADWVVFGAGSVSRNRPESQALKRLLAERPDLLRNKRVIVFAFNAPYYLDATDISKITAYYGLYSKTNAFVDTAVRILFQELSPVGALPVSVPGVGYDLIKATSPDPNQVIQLFLDFGEPNKQATPTFLPPNAKTLQPPPSPTATAVPLFKVGDILPLRTGVILDRNKNSVPDGTVVRFTITTGGGESRSVLPVETVSVKGIARTNFRIQNPGFIEVAASSDLAVNSDIFRLDILPGQAAAITAIVPTSSAPTQTPVPTKTTTPTPTATPTPPPAPPAAAGFVDWILAVLVAWGSAAGVFWVGRRLVNLRWGVRWGFCTALGGLIVYVYVAFNLPGVQSLIERDGSAGVAAVTLLGALAGWSVGWLWRWLLEQNSQAPQKQN
jgi:beta-N-acetylhexosaminidase